MRRIDFVHSAWRWGCLQFFNEQKNYLEFYLVTMPIDAMTYYLRNQSVPILMRVGTVGLGRYKDAMTTTAVGQTPGRHQGRPTSVKTEISFAVCANSQAMHSPAHPERQFFECILCQYVPFARRHLACKKHP